MPSPEVPAHDGRVSALAFTTDGRLLVSGGADGRLRVWDASTGDEVHHLDGHRGEPGFETISDLAISPDGRWLASAGWHDRTVQVWELATGRLVRTFEHASPVSGVGFVRHDGGSLVSCEENRLSFWNIDAEEAVAVVAGAEGRPPNAVRCLGIASVHYTVAVAGKGLCLWVPRTRQMQRVLAREWPSVDVVAWSVDGRMLAAMGEGGRLGIWDLLSGGQPAGKGQAPTPRVRDMVQGLGPEWVLASEVILVWNPTNGAFRALSTAWEAQAACLARPRDGSFLAAGTEDGHVRLLDLHTGRHLRSFGTEMPEARRRAPDGRILLEDDWRMENLKKTRTDLLETLGARSGS